MTLIIVWKDPKRWGEAQTSFPNIDPKTINMSYDTLCFGTEGWQNHWAHSMSHIKEFRFE